MRRYRRYFIIFELGDKDFGAFVGEEAKGHAKIEVKNGRGLLSINCQNLQSSSGGNRYGWYLINTKMDEAPVIVEIGPMEADEKGRGELICEFDAEDVRGSMEQIDDFDVLALVVRNKDKENKLCTPLVGYMDKDKSDAGSWRYALGKYLYIPSDDERAAAGKTVRFYQPAADRAAEESKAEVAEEIAKAPAEKTADRAVGEDAETSAEEAVDEVVEKIAEEITEGSADGAVKETAGEIEKDAAERAEAETEKESARKVAKDIIKDDAKDDREIVEGVAKKTAEEIEDGAEETEEKAEEKTKKGAAEEAIEKIREKNKEKRKTGYFIRSEIEQKDSDPAEVKKDEYRVQMQAYIENSLKDFPEVEPFADNLENYTWWEISYDAQTMYRPYMPFILYLDSLKESSDYHVSKMLQAVYIYQHHIFGICYDKDNGAKYYAYGISGKNSFSEQPFELSEDFVYWYPCNNVPINIESCGYWVLTIDPETGEAVRCR